MKAHDSSNTEFKPKYLHDYSSKDYISLLLQAADTD